MYTPGSHVSYFIDTGGHVENGISRVTSCSKHAFRAQTLPKPSLYLAPFLREREASRTLSEPVTGERTHRQVPILRS